MERCEVISGAGTIRHLDRRLRQLDEILYAKSRGPGIVEDIEVDEIDGGLDADEFHILATVVEPAILNRQKD